MVITTYYQVSINHLGQRLDSINHPGSTVGESCDVKSDIVLILSSYVGYLLILLYLER